LNFPMQSSGATLTNNAIKAINKEIRWDQGEAILSNEHDAIYLEGPDPLRLGHLLKQHMEQTITLNGRTMTFPVDLGIGKDWKNFLKVNDLSKWPDFLSSLSVWFSSPVSAPLAQ
jgi:DNA polymerase I-like protein with 3'-5' exonuclease and polymerase domains